MSERPIRFSADDLALFSAASHDRNPLHLSAAYARTTAYGTPVVFGVLGALACLGRLARRPARTLSRLVVEFSSPLFPDVEYTLQLSEDSAEQATARLYDGQRAVLKLSASFRPGEAPALPAEPIGAPALAEARSWPESALSPELSVDGRYAPDWQQLPALIERWALRDTGVGPAQLAALLWSSYLVGMELPGRRALFARLLLEWQPAPAATAGAYAARVRSFDRRFNLLRLDVQLEAEGSLARGELRAFVLPEPPAVAKPGPEAIAPSRELAGQVALVIGASRGLGARLVAALAWRGCTVLANFQRSQDQAAALAETLADAPGRVVLLPGDGADPGWCGAAREQILREYGRLDTLICNASPALVPLWLDPNALERIHAFIARSVALVSVPLAVFGLLLAGHSGRAIVISSAAVSAAPAEWPHYVAAKRAVEGLAEVAAREYPAAHFAIVRPPRLQTELTATPAGYDSALPPEIVAAAICAWIDAPPAPGKVALLDTFTAPGPEE